MKANSKKNAQWWFNEISKGENLNAEMNQYYNSLSQKEQKEFQEAYSNELHKEINQAKKLAIEAKEFMRTY